MHSLVPELFPAKLAFSFPGDPPERKNSAFLVAIFCVLLVAKICVVLFTDYNRRLAYFYTPANLTNLKVKFEYSYRTRDKKKQKNLIGIYKRKWKWHYALSVKPILSPILGFYLKSHLTFTDDGFKVWRNENGEIDKDKIHSHRRSKGKTFFNEEWRDMFLAFLHGLKNKDGLILIPLSCDFTLQLFPEPEIFWSEFGYYDPKDKTRQGLLSTYEEDDDELIIENTNEGT